MHSGAARSEVQMIRIVKKEGHLAAGGPTLTQFQNVIRAIVEVKVCGCRPTMVAPLRAGLANANFRVRELREVG